jgi:16S rRNA (guanine966-N2)-methyltransferase
MNQPPRERISDPGTSCEKRDREAADFEMRITGGSLRGRRLAAFRGPDIRPTSDLVREAIFDLLGLRSLSEARVLDLFAGTGSLGIEALSRGASHVLFIDHSRKAIELIRKNLKLCGLEASGFALNKDLARGALSRNPWLLEPFDLVFLDPPYGKALILPLLQTLQRDSLLRSTSMVVAQTEKRQDLPQAIGHLKTAKVRTYGATRITLLEKEEDS